MSITARREVLLEILIVDSSESSNLKLAKTLEKSPRVADAAIAVTFDEAIEVLISNDRNTIFIDVLQFDLETAEDFVFRIRHAYPDIVFVLYCSRSSMEAVRARFYLGRRSRFLHYFFLDKDAPDAIFIRELEIVIGQCVYAHQWIGALNGIEQLRKSMLEGHLNGDSRDADTVEHVRA